MKSNLKPEEVFTGFELITLHQLSASDFLSSKVPAEILLVILADFDKKQSERIIRLIIEKLILYCENENELRKFVNKLTVLSRSLNLDEQTKKIIQIMPITYDITKDSFYQEWLEQGLEKAIIKMLNNNMEVNSIAKIMNITKE